ncbi:oligosaccharide flippase family protein [Rhodobaculum claviforme]|uniref:Polysaccharide biosynthesis protein n=1 Tax=Rhodobaculum claviforme TaxID=1549854 RepID=A0A934WHV2_9RHOB|nr:oligosaccharide flippase family protein [Rhodobaculum claviforme]MBK5925903.1 polysaccharide biosynthesis protein [Rhodobaculum claviforme]
MIARLTRATGPFGGHLLAYGASEAAAKASRLLVVIAVARSMDAAAIGIAAAALAVADITKSLTENGVGQRIIAAPDDRLAATCATAHRIFWGWALGLFTLQLGLGLAAALIWGDWLFFVLLAVLAGEYLFMPGGLVQAALAMREGKMRQTAAIAGGQVVGANIATAVLALIWPGPLALVVPRLIAAPIWLVAMRRLRPWRRDPGAGRVPLRHFTGFGVAVLGVEVVKALRLQADKLVIGALAGAEVLGVYFLAFNAGLGLANSFSIAFSTVLFPHLARATDREAALRQAVLLAMGLIAPVVVLQALLAPVYVPLLFGPDWAHIAPVVSILCLAAIPSVLWSASAQWLRSTGRAGAEFNRTLVMTVALIATTAALAPHGILAIAWGYLVVAGLTQVVFAAPALVAAFRPRPLEV